MEVVPITKGSKDFGETCLVGFFACIQYIDLATAKSEAPIDKFIT